MHRSELISSLRSKKSAERTLKLLISSRFARKVGERGSNAGETTARKRSMTNHLPLCLSFMGAHEGSTRRQHTKGIVCQMNDLLNERYCYIVPYNSRVNLPVDLWPTQPNTIVAPAEKVVKVGSE